jgi:hypothetical protein
MARPRALTVCPCSGCPAHPYRCTALVRGGRCPRCERQADRARGSRQARGYDTEHDRLRARWKPRVEAGGVHCHAAVCVEPARLILAGQAWDLGHTADRTAWTGPEHASCNRSAGGKAAHGT